MDQKALADFIVYLNLTLFAIYQITAIIVISKNRCRLDSSAIVSILSYLLCTFSIEATFLLSYYENHF